MHVTRVELENIKSYEHAAFDFARGTTAIVGPNGAGKTTLLEAIAWTLFDVLDYSKDDFLRRGAKRGNVRVTFQDDLDERLYMVYRDTGTSYYIYDPELKQKLATGKADVRKFLDLHLGVEPGTDVQALFKSAIGVPQGTLTADFLKPKSQREAAFNKLLKVEEYRESAERLRDTINLIEKRINDARVRVGNAEGQLARYDELVAEHASARARAEELSDALASLQREAKERERVVVEMDEAERRVGETRAAAERLEVERDSAERRLKDLLNGLEAARRAGERLSATEADYRAHLDSLKELRALETERAERDRLRAEAAEAARLTTAAEADARRLEEALQRAVRAGEALAALAVDISAQEELERERERLRDLLAQARAAEERLSRLDQELESLRRQHSETSKRVRATEGLAGAQAEAERLESERLGIETRLSRIEQALTARKHLTGQRRESAREVERLRRSVAALEKETRELEQGSAAVRGLSALEARERELMLRAAALRDAIQRDETAGEKGGVCPILHETCRNLAAEGRTFEEHFADQLKTNRTQLATIEVESTRLSREVRAAREAEKMAARFDGTRARLNGERELLSEREAALARVDAELAALTDADVELRDQLRAEMIGVSGVLVNAREDALRYAELEPLRARLKEIEDEGRRRRDEREQVAATAGAGEGLARDASEVERRLRELNDPRGRAASLRAEAVREEELRREVGSAAGALDALRVQQAALEERLMKFSGFDERWSRATSERERTAAAHNEYLESRSLAATLPLREAEAREAESAAARVRREAEERRAEYEQALSAYDRERHGAERVALTLTRERAAATSAQLDAEREKETSLGARIAQLEEVRAAWQREIREIERMQELYKATDFIRDILRKASTYVAESYLYNISIEANQLFREITGEGGRSLRWSKDYDILLEEGGHERSFLNLSGGEQMVAALSVRLALLKQLSDIRVAFFDEPTVNMDAERRERLAQQIGQVRDFDQLFVISHDDTFEEAVDHVISVSRAGVEEVA